MNTETPCRFRAPTGRRRARAGVARVVVALLALAVLPACEVNELRHGSFADLDGSPKEVYATARATLQRFGIRRSGVVFTPLSRGDRRGEFRRGRSRYSVAVRQEGDRSRLHVGSDDPALAFQVVFHASLADQRAAGRRHGQQGFRPLPGWVVPAQAAVRRAGRLAARPW